MSMDPLTVKTAMQAFSGMGSAFAENVIIAYDSRDESFYELTGGGNNVGVMADGTPAVFFSLRQIDTQLVYPTRKAGE